MVPRELLDFIREGSKFLITGHKDPDGDCVGSQLALDSALRRMGKETLLLSSGPFKRTEIKPYEHLFSLKDALEHVPGGSACRVIILDCSSPERTGDLEPFLIGFPSAVIDHHRNGKHSNGPHYIDENATSTTVMVLKLILALGLKPTREEAEHLFFWALHGYRFFSPFGLKRRGNLCNGGYAFKLWSQPKGCLRCHTWRQKP